jgi:hypothetical protein
VLDRNGLHADEGGRHAHYVQPDGCESRERLNQA